MLSEINPLDLLKFEIEALAASNSGELTSLVYKCEIQHKEGLVLGFLEITGMKLE